MVSYILAFACGLAVLGVDRLTKYLVATEFALGETREFINGFIDLTYIHNKGGAWGMLYGKTYILVPLTVIVMGLCIYLYVKYAKGNKLTLWAMSLILSGGIGNMIDRVWNGGNVVDFLHFEFYPTFPVFNIADCAIVVGAGLFILYTVLDIIKEYRSKKTEL